MLLATIANRLLSERCWIAHTISPAVPIEDTERLVAFSKREGWNLKIIETDEFSDEAYLSNPINRCYHCKRHLYEALSSISNEFSFDRTVSYPLVSGANIDDLREYRPGLQAARRYAVRHPFVEAGINKSDIRKISEFLALPFSDLPASPCLASRLYTGTRVTRDRLLAAHFAENTLKQLAGVRVVRCRLQDDEMTVEVLGDERALITQEVIGRLRNTLQVRHPRIGNVRLDPIDYAPGRAFQADS